jgi:energy-coupling factor transporter ATP-binding protein EcfA2
MARKTAHLDTDRAVRMFGPTGNATFAELPDWKDMKSLDLVAEVTFSIEERMNLLVRGPSGCGKTELVKALTPCHIIEDQAVTPVYFSCAVLTGDNLKVAFPYETTVEARLYRFLRYLLDQRLMVPGYKVAIWDEVGQAERDLFNALMEALSEKTFANHDPNLLCNILLDNPNTGEYGSLQEMEYAQASRMQSIDITAKDSPWPRAVAARYAHRDLSKAIKVYNRWWSKFDSLSQGYASPRVFDQGIIMCLEEGIPAIHGIPFGPEGDHFELRTASGETAAKRDKDGKVIETVTEAFLNEIAEALELPNPTRFDNKLEKAAEVMLRRGIDVYTEGPPGSGKTSRIKALLAEEYPHIGAPYISMANTSKEDIVIPFPAENAGEGEELVGSMDQLTFGFLGLPGDKVLIADEYTRGIDNRATNVVNELVQSGTVNGWRVPGLIGVWAINNPPHHAGEDLDCRTLTLPQASRFALSFKVDDGDTNSLEWLDATYGEPVRPFIRWRKGGLNPAQQDNVSARVLEMMFKRHIRGRDMKAALPVVKGRRVDVPLIDLLKTLKDEPMANLTAMAEELDLWVDKLSQRNEFDEVVFPGMHVDAYQALYYATLGHLKEHETVVVEIFKVIDDEHRFKLIGQDDKPEIQEFWYQILDQAVPD